MTIDDTKAKPLTLPARILTALEASGCPDIERAARVFAVLREHGESTATHPFGTKAHIAYQQACVRVSTRLLAPEPWGPTDLDAIEAETVPYRKG